MLPAGLSMLWERADARHALATRFGFADPAAAATWCADALRRNWGIDDCAVARFVISDRNAIVWASTDRGRVVVKLTADRDAFARLESSTRLMRDLADRGVPVPAPHPTRDGLVRAIAPTESGELSVAVLPEVEGDWLDVADVGAVGRVGACLAELHDVLRELGPDVPDGSSFDTATLERSIRSDRGRRAPRAVRRIRELLADGVGLDDEMQPVHNDIRAANVLMRDSRVAAVLDFDEVSAGTRVADLAKASVYLATMFTEWRPTPEPARTALVEGYASVHRLDAAAARRLELLTLWHGVQAIPEGPDPGGWARSVELMVGGDDARDVERKADVLP